MLESRRTQPKVKTWNSMYDEYVEEADLLKLKQKKFPIYYGRTAKLAPRRVQVAGRRVSYALNEAV